MGPRTNSVSIVSNCRYLDKVNKTAGILSLFYRKTKKRLKKEKLLLSKSPPLFELLRSTFCNFYKILICSINVLP